jgi:hypothetical protein
LKFEEYRQTFKSHIHIDKDKFENIYTFAKTRNILHEKPELAADKGIKGTLLSRRGPVSCMYDLSQTLLMKVN